MLTIILHAANVPNAMAQPLGRCIVKVRPASWSFGLATAQAWTRPGALSTDRLCACNHSRAEIWICSWASAVGRDLRLVTCDDADNMCSPGSRSHYTANSIGNCSALRSKSIWLAMLGSVCRFSIAVTVQWTTAASLARAVIPLNQVPAKNQAYVPNKLRLTAHLSPRICSYRWMLSTAMHVAPCQQTLVGSLTR
jgi:hypothetical protein